MPPVARGRARGVVLVAVLAVAALVAIIAAGLMFRVRAEMAASASGSRGEQAYEAAMAGVARAITVLRISSNDPAVWYDNPDIFQNQLVADDGANRWYFTVYGDPLDPQQGIPRYGLTDEAGKINLNVAPIETLMGLPNMTSELVDCLMDFRDADSDTRSEGAEQDYYDHLESPYIIPNGPLETLEELLMVKGFNAQIIYGEDANMNGLLEQNEDDGDESFPPDGRDGHLDKGLRGVATVVTSEPNNNAAGKARININADSPPSRVPGLSDKAIQFILMYRSEGNTFKHPSELLEMKYTLKQDHPELPIAKKGVEIDSDVKGEQLAAVLDELTTLPVDKSKPILGLVNVNTASAEALAVLPGMDPNLAQQIVDARRDLDTETKSSPAWLYTQNLLDAAAFKMVAPYLTTRSFQYSLRCVGFGVPCGRYRVLEVVVDMGGGTPRVVYMRDISRTGMPFALNVEAMERSR
ncbi:MAG: type II secretion system protein GspK [Planctomycetota bacterium]|nr:type II secretion system protein GspK [Planctomycetota bacterium]